MTKFIGIISAKGGVGKTTTAINLTSALHFFKRDVIALDANFNNPDMGIHLGIPVAKNTLHSALKGKHSIKKSVYRHVSGIKVIPGNVSYHEGKSTHSKNLISAIYDLYGASEAVIIDSAPGMGDDARTVIRASDFLLIVTTSDLISVSGSLKMIKLAEEMGKRVLGVIVNKKRNEGYEMAVSNIEEFLGAKVICIIPEESRVRYSMKTNMPLIISHPNNAVSISFKKLAGELIGEKYVENIEKKENKSLFNDVMKRLGFQKV